MPGTQVPGILPFVGVFIFYSKNIASGDCSSGRVFVFKYSIVHPASFPHCMLQSKQNVPAGPGAGHQTAAQAFFSPQQRKAEISSIALASSSPSIITSILSPDTA